MEASTYAWAVILTFFVLYATIQLRKCFLQLLASSGERNGTTSRLSTSSVYTIENDNAVRSYRNDQEMLGSMNSANEKKDDKDLPTYEQVIATDRLQPINHFSSSSAISDVFVASSSNVTTSSTTINR